MSTYLIDSNQNTNILFTVIIMQKYTKQIRHIQLICWWWTLGNSTSTWWWWRWSAASLIGQRWLGPIKSKLNLTECHWANGCVMFHYKSLILPFLPWPASPSTPATSGGRWWWPWPTSGSPLLSVSKSLSLPWPGAGSWPRSWPWPWPGTSTSLLSFSLFLLFF